LARIEGWIAISVRTSVDARAICVRLGHVRLLATWNRLR
jgi:hypothetical protein